MTGKQIEQLWISEGGPRWAAPLMAAIAIAESKGEPNALNDNPDTKDFSVGLFQINYFGDLRESRTARYGSPESLRKNVRAQIHAAIDLFDNGAGLGNWKNDPAYEAYQAKGMAGVQPFLSQGSPSPSIPGGGGSSAAARYMSPVAKDATFERVDQGVDYSQSQPYRAVGDGVVTAITGGWHGGTGIGVYITLDHPIKVNGRTYDQVYYAELQPLVKQGERVKAGQPVVAGGAGELGFAHNNGPVAPLTGGYGAGTQASVQGHDFLSLVSGGGDVSAAKVPAQAATASYHRQLPNSQYQLPNDLAGNMGEFGPQTTQNLSAQQSVQFGDQAGATSPYGIFQAASVWQQLAQTANASPETRLMANAASQVVQNTPHILAGIAGLF